MSIITSGKLPPERHAERCRKHRDHYSPTLEELLCDSLKDVVIQDREAYFQYKLRRYSPGSREVQKERQRLEKHIRKVGHAASYVHTYPRRIYTVSENRQSDASLALFTVHEAAHAAHYRMMDSGEANRLCHDALRDIIIEGFAEYVSLEAFKYHYDLPGIEPVLERRRRWHKEGNDIYAGDRLYRFHDFFKEGEIVMPEEMKSNRLKAGFHKIRMWLVRFSSGSPEEYCDAAGYTFFKTAADAGISPLTIIHNPPKDIESIIDPADYIQEMTS